VKRATVAASGDRLLISLLVNAKEKKSFFGLAAKPMCISGASRCSIRCSRACGDQRELAVESEAAFGLLGGGARAMPHLQKALPTRPPSTSSRLPRTRRKRSRPRYRIFRRTRTACGWRGNHQPAPHRHRLRFQNAARDREAAGAINVYVTALPVVTLFSFSPLFAGEEKQAGFASPMLYEPSNLNETLSLAR